MNKLLKLGWALGGSLGFIYVSVNGLHYATPVRAKMRADGSTPGGTERRKSATSVTDRPGDEADGGDLTLRKVLVFFRHGARTPLHLIPGIEEVAYPSQFLCSVVPHTNISIQVVNIDGGPKPPSYIEDFYRKNVLKGGLFYGMLTNLGQDQMYMLGRQLRKKYIDQLHLIGADYDKNEVYIRSTNIARTIASLRCVMAGLYGAKALREKGVLDILVSDLLKDELIPRPQVCPLLHLYHYRALEQSDSFPGMREDRIKIEKVIGIDSANGGPQLNFFDARDDLVARMQHGLPFPEELNPYFDKIDENATKLFFYALCGEPEKDRFLASKLSSGPALNMALRHLGSEDKDSSHKVFLYSCHDSTLMGLLGAMDIFDHKWPPLAADLRMELFEDSAGKLWIKASYLSKDCILRGCDKVMCPYQQFVKAISPLLQSEDEYKASCHSEALKKIAAVKEDSLKDDKRSDIAAGL